MISVNGLFVWKSVVNAVMVSCVAPWVRRSSVKCCMRRRMSSVRRSLCGSVPLPGVAVV